MAEVLADHHDNAIATDDFALIANLFDAWFDLHDPPLTSGYCCLLVSVDDATSGEVIWT